MNTPVQRLSMSSFNGILGFLFASLHLVQKYTLLKFGYTRYILYVATGYTSVPIFQ